MAYTLEFKKLITVAFNLGKKASRNNKRLVPAWDKDLMKLLSSRKKRFETIKLMDAWETGFINQSMK